MRAPALFPLSRWVRRGAAPPRGPVLAAAALVAAAACIPAVYLGVRAGEVSADAWSLLLVPRTFRLLGSTLALALGVTALSALLALPLAWLTALSNLPGRKVWAVLFTLPLAVPSFIFGYVLLAAFGVGGLFDEWGLPAPPVYGYWGALWALTLSTYPFLFLAFRAALIQQDPALLEAARCLGCPPLEAFRRVTLPRLGHALRSGGLLVAFYVLSDFGAVSLLQYDTFSRAIYMQLEGSFDRSLAALWSLVLVALALLALILAEMRAPRAARAGRVAQRHSAPAKLGRLAVPSLLGCALVVLGGVGLPVGVIGVWLARASSAARASSTESGGTLWEPVWNSVVASSLAAVVTAVCALPLGIVSARYGASLLARGVVRAAFASYCLPPIVVALSLVAFGIHVVPAVYGTLLMLVFAHVVRFLPQALGPIEGAFVDLSPRLSEAGSSLGAAPPRVALRIVLPLIRPGLVAAVALVFLTVMKELPATLLLAPIGFQTLSTRIWSATAEGQFALGAVPAFLLLAVSSLSVALTLRHERAGRAGGAP